MLTIKEKEIVIFTDGSSRGNPGPGGYGAVAIYPNSHGEMMVDEVGGGLDQTTNNRMELTAVIEGIKNFLYYYDNLADYTFRIHTDSSYVLKGANEWLEGWKKKNWISSTKEEVKNQDLWQIYDELVSKGDGKGKLKILWKLVKGHSGVAGNERCDVIATGFADNKTFDLFTGTLVKYQENICPNILDIGGDFGSAKSISGIIGASSIADALSTNGTKGSKSQKAYSYVSLVSGKINVDKNWADCEKRVKGVSGTKFKKSFSKEDEQKIIDSFLMNS
jgi:ribonuclease HI